MNNSVLSVLWDNGITVFGLNREMLEGVLRLVPIVFREFKSRATNLPYLAAFEIDIFYFSS